MNKLIAMGAFCIVAGLLISCSTTSILFKIEPTNHNFGQVNISETATFDFVVTNKKSVDMTVTALSFLTGEFSDISGAQGKTIVSKGTLTITVRFAPGLPGGLKNDTMHIEWVDINGKTGKKDVKLEGESVPVPLISGPATTYDFGTIGIGNNSTHNFDIQNTGSANLILSLFNFNGNPTLFSITAGGATPVTIIPGATHTVTVQFVPTATGAFPTVFEITHNAINAVPPATVTIDAAGGGGKVELNQTSPWDFGLGRINFAKTDVVEIENTGSIDLNIQSVNLATGTMYSVDKIENSSGNPVTTPFAISAGDFAEVTIKFTPTSVSNFNDTLSIAHDGSYSASPAVLSLTGSGRNPITVTTTYTGAAVNWNVPAGVASLTAEVWGSQGAGGRGGRGARMKGDFTVTPGGTLEVYAGGNPGMYAGGQGSYVAASATLLIMAGAGGGGNHQNGLAAVITENGTYSYQSCSYTGGAPGTAGNGGLGGNGSWGTGGGGGWLSAGGNASGTHGGAIKGKASSGTTFAGGAGGGYSGGGGCAMASGWCTAGGGSGGSKNNGTNQSNTAGTRTGTGEVKIVY